MTQEEIVKAFNMGLADEVYDELIRTVQGVIDRRLDLPEGATESVYLYPNGDVGYEEENGEHVFTITGYTNAEKEKIILDGSTWKEELRKYRHSDKLVDSEEEAKKIAIKIGLYKSLKEEAEKVLEWKNIRTQDGDAYNVVALWMEKKGVTIVDDADGYPVAQGEK